MLSAALAATLLGCAGGSAAALSGGRTAPADPAGPLSVLPQASAAQAAATAGGRGGTTVTLITGERVHVNGAAGHQQVSVTPSASGAVPLVDTFTVSGDLYVVPRDAGPYLGTLLDRRLFDVSLLTRLGFDDTRQKAIPVTVGWKTDRHPVAAPGVTAPIKGRTTSGTVDKSRATAFGAALASRFAADRHVPAGRTSARITGKAGGLNDVNAVSLAVPESGPLLPASGGAAPTTGRPAAPPATVGGTPDGGDNAANGVRLYTLTIDAIERDGQPGYARIDVQNLDDLRHYWSVSWVAPGQPVALSVPAGRYSIEAFVGTPVASSLFQNSTFVALPDVSVRRDRSVTADARTAKPMTITTPRPAETGMVGLSYTREGADGRAFAGTVLGFGRSELLQVFGPGQEYPDLRAFATPTGAHGVGALHFADSWLLEPPGRGFGANPAYAYYLDYAGDEGVPARLDHDLGAGDLATVQENYAADQPGQGAEYFSPHHSWSPYDTYLSVYNFALPGTRTNYFGGAGSPAWQPAVFDDVNDAAASVIGTARAYEPGRRTSESWLAGPLVPTPTAESGLVAPSAAGDGHSSMCPVCRQDDTMLFDVTDYGDAAGHWAYLPRTGEDLKFYRDDVLTQEQPRSGGIFPMLPGSASYKIDWVTHPAATGSPLDSTVESVWTFTSRHPDRPDKIPSFEYCGPDVTRGCSLLPLVFASYGLDVDQSGRAPASRPETFRLTGYHQAHETNASPVTKAAVEVSFDDGATWAAVSDVRADHGGFAVTVPAGPPAGGKSTGYVSLRTRLSDTSGSALSQTIIRAYALPTTAAVSHGR
ncbi:hypothetical protein GCM10023196_020260 [Actinoallomurus vinaceus]|uniref:Uncharacterized protein n=1 Tax=Actinoallomurus vinaceus TaxID=1080074 RepID=A0ABP8U4R5_9ACTN